MNGIEGQTPPERSYTVLVTRVIIMQYEVVVHGPDDDEKNTKAAAVALVRDKMSGPPVSIGTYFTSHICED